MTKVNDKGKRIPTPKKVTLNALKNAIRGTGGVISVIAQKLDVSWDTVRHALEFWEEARVEMDVEIETNLDLAESVILRNIRSAIKMQQDGYSGVDSSDAKWYLRAKGARRGYADDAGVNITNTNALASDGAQVLLYIPDNGRDNLNVAVKPKSKTNDAKSEKK